MTISRECLTLLFGCIRAWSYPTLCNPMDCSSPGSSVHGIFQTRILEWVAIPSSRGSSRLKDWTFISYVQPRKWQQQSLGGCLSDSRSSSWSLLFYLSRALNIFLPYLPHVQNEVVGIDNFWIDFQLSLFWFYEVKASQIWKRACLLTLREQCAKKIFPHFCLRLICLSHMFT